ALTMKIEIGTILLFIYAVFFCSACQQNSESYSDADQAVTDLTVVQPNNSLTPAESSASYRFERVGKAILPNQNENLMDNIAYSKLAPWPYTDGNVFYTGCYDPTRIDNDEPWNDRCFAVIDISDPLAPVRVATVPGYDPKLSPAPPQGHIIWQDDYPFPDLPIQAPCLVDWDDPAIAAAERAPQCWDPGWNTHTHYVSKGPNGLLAVNQESYRLGTHRQHNYRGVKFYDVSDPANPIFLSYWQAPASPFDHSADEYPDMHGVHHFNFEDNYLMLGGEYEGYIGKIFIILDVADPSNPVEVSKFHLPGQKTPEEDDLRNWEQSPKFNFPVVELDNGKWSKYYGMHYVSIDNDRAYLSYHQAGLVILDVADKANPKLLSHTDYIMPEAQQNSPDAEACIASGGGVPTACGNAHSAKVLPTNPNILIMTDEYFSCPFGHMRIFDVEDPTQPVILSRVLLPESTDCDPSNPTKAVNASRYPNRGPSTHIGNYFGGELEDIYVVAWYGAGVRAIDLSDITNPKVVAEYQYSIADDFPQIDSQVTDKLIGQDTYDVIQGPDGHLYVSDGSAGLRVVKLIKE
ncbi:hypothetical protein N9060_02475, partial [Arenicella sp.]|nr:hypothetical protein [Arenicella sp.]